MKKAILIVLTVAVFALVTGCAGALVQKEAVAKVKYAGVLSLTVANPGPATPANTAVVQQVADYALPLLESKLKSAGIFKVVSSSAMAKVPEYQNAGTVAKAAGASKFLKENPSALSEESGMSSGIPKESSNEDFMTALKKGLQNAASNMAKMADPAAAAQKEIDGYKEKSVSARGVPFIPYGLINNNTAGTVTYVNGVKQGGPNEGLKQMLIAEAKEVCAKTRLDAVIIAYADVLTPPPSGVRVVVGDRVVGTLKLDMTMAIIDKNGEIIADFEYPVMDDLAPMKLAKPTHKAVTWRQSGGKNWPDKIEVDLQDGRGELLNELKDLANTASGNLVKKLVEEMNRK